MGRKRKIVAKSSAAAVEAKSSNLYRGISLSDEKLPSQTPVEGLNTENNSKGLPKKRKASNEPLRRSGRLKSHGIKPTVEHVDLDQIEKQEPLQSEKVNSPLQVVNEKSSEVDTQVEKIGPPNDANKKSLNEIVSYFVQAVDEFKHKVSERLDEDPSPDVRYKSLYFSSQKKVHERSDDGPSPDVHYKNLYFDSQKKLQELMEENYELVRKLEFAEGQVAAYQKMIGVMGPVKEVMFVSRFEKSVKDNVSLLPQVAQNCVPSTPAANANEEPKQKKRSYKKRKA